MSRSGAPVINKGAIQEQGPARPVTPAEREQEQLKQARREQVKVAVEFGAALIDLVAYTRQGAYARLQRNESGPAPRILGVRFPPDLLVSIPPEANLKRTRQKLLKLESMLLNPEQPDGPQQPAGGPRQPEGPSEAARPAKTGGMRLGGTRQPEGPGKAARLAGTGGMESVGTQRPGGGQRDTATAARTAGEDRGNGARRDAAAGEPGGTQQQAWQRGQQVWQRTQQAKQAEQRARQARQQA